MEVTSVETGPSLEVFACFQQSLGPSQAGGHAPPKNNGVGAALQARAGVLGTSCRLLICCGSRDLQHLGQGRCPQSGPRKCRKRLREATQSSFPPK